MVAVVAVVAATVVVAAARVLALAAGAALAGCCAPTCVFGLCDPFPNKDRIRRATCPILLVHGTHDQTVDCSPSIELYRRTPESCFERILPQ